MTAKKPLLLIGCGGHCHYIDIVEQQGIWEIYGLVGTPSDVGKKVLDYEVVGCDMAYLPYVLSPTTRF